VAGGCQCVQFLIYSEIHFTDRDRHEQSVGSIDRRLTKRLAGNGQDSFAFLASAFCNKLFDPQPE